MKIPVLLILTCLLQFAIGQQRMTYTPETSMLSENNANCIAGDGDAVHMVWHEEYEGQLYSGVHYRRSLDNGDTWEDAYRFGYGYNPSIAVQGNEVHVVLGAGSIYYFRSTDNGNTWDYIPLPDNDGDHPSLAVSGNQVHIVWHTGSGDHGDIHYCRSDDRGNTWSAIQRLNLDSQSKAKYPSIAVDEDYVHVVYQVSDGLFYHRSDDMGNSWPVSNITSWPFFSRPSIASSDRWVVITCIGVDIATISSANHGTTWDLGQYPIVDGSAGGALSPHIASSGKIFFLSWNQIVNGTWSILTSHSNDGGVTWNPIASLSPITGYFSCRPFALLKGKDIHLVATDNIYAGGKHEIFYLKEENKLIELGRTYVEWGFSTGSDKAEICNDIVVDEEGNVYATGYFENVVDFDPGPSEWKLTSAGRRDMFIAKYDPHGHLVWARNIGASKDDSGKSICLDSAGNILIAGGYDELVYFDSPGGDAHFFSKGDQDIFILRLNKEGEYISVYVLGDEGHDYPGDIEVSSNGNIILSGTFSGTVDFNRLGYYPLISNGPTDIFLYILDKDGKFINAQALGGRQDASPSGIGIDSHDNIYLTGTFRDTMDVMAGAGIRELISKGSSDAFVLAVDDLGQYRWSGLLGSNGTDAGSDIVIDSDGDLILTGTFAGVLSVETDSMQITIPNDEVYLVQLDQYGRSHWAKGLELHGSNRLCLGTNAQDEIYMLGSYQSIGFDPYSEYNWYASDGFNDILLLKYSSDGEFLWLKEYSGPGYSYVSSMDVNELSEIYITGTFSDKLYLEPGNLYAPLSDPPGNLWNYYIAKIVECLPTYVNLNDTACEVYLAPDGVTEWTSSGTYQLMVRTNQGCDSVFTVELIILESSMSSIQVSTCDMYTSPTGKTWNATGIYQDTLVNTLGCDSIITFHLSVLKETNLIDNVEACEIFQTSQGHVITSTGMVSDTLINQAGCDSIVIYNVEIHPHQTYSYDITVCHSYTTPDGLFTWNESGVYEYSLMTAAGCDSSIMVDLEIRPLDVGVTQLDTALIANLSDATYKWLNCETGELIDGETSQTFIPKESGIYAVILESNSCIDTTACYAIVLVHVEDQFKDEHIRIYPNPVSDRLFFEYSGPCEKMEISLYDPLGRLHLEKNITTCETLLLPPVIRSGVYYAKIKVRDVTGVYRVVVE